MKILRFDAFSDSASGLSPAAFFAETAVMMADSSMRPHRRPLFVPDEGFWLCDLRPAIKISLLGKNIERSFAPRYYGEFTIVNLMVREPDGDPVLTPGFMLDDAIVCGDWIPVADRAVDLTIGGIHDHDIHKDFTVDRDFVDSAIASLSKNATFKTGDMLVLPHSLAHYVPRRDTRITVQADGSTILDFKIK